MILHTGPLSHRSPLAVRLRISHDAMGRSASGGMFLRRRFAAFEHARALPGTPTCSPAAVHGSEHSTPVAAREHGARRRLTDAAYSSSTCVFGSAARSSAMAASDNLVLATTRILTFRIRFSGVTAASVSPVPDTQSRLRAGNSAT